MTRAKKREWVVVSMLALTAMGAAACGKDGAPGGDHKVFFVGYVYDGASGTRLGKSSLSAISIVHGDTTIPVDIQDDGRFVSRAPLPTWRDYTVTIKGAGYRAFVSYNTGIDVPASLAMTDGIAQASTTQTLDFAAYLFPISLESPALSLTVTVPDSITGAPISSGIDGTLRLRPQAQSTLQISGTSQGVPVSRVWPNDEDLLTQTVTKTFTDGAVALAAGELVYGVSYDVAIFDVDGYQPFPAVTGSAGFVAGQVTSRTYLLVPKLQDPLAIVQDDAATCVPPAGTDTIYGARVTLTFNAEIEIVGTAYREDFDNLFSITTPLPPLGTSFCPLKLPFTDPTQLERGSRVEVSGRALTFSFSPSVGLAATTATGLACLPPPTITSVTYGAPSSLLLQPVGDPSRRRPLSLLLGARQSSTTVVCPTRPGI